MTAEVTGTRFAMADRALSPLLQAGILTLATIVVLFIRRPDQFLHPYIWVEDGLRTLREYTDVGYGTLLEPWGGYFMTASKLISVIAYKLSVLWAPEIELVLIVGLTAAVIVAIALSPTHLRWPFLCALAVLLLPTDAEVFAVSSYAFWWAGVLLFIAVLWDSDRGRQWLRWLYLVFGGLSGPIIVPIAALQGVRALVERTRSEVLAFGVAAVVTAIQLVAMRSPHGNLPIATPSPEFVPLIVRKFVGNFFYAGGGVWFGVGVLTVLLVAGWLVRERLDRYFALLVLMFVSVSVAVMARHDPEKFQHMHAFLIAPRYFFYPFILLSWIMIWIAALSTVPVRIAFAAAFALAVIVAGPGLNRRHEPLDWRQHILACARSDGAYEVPIHMNGRIEDLWKLELTGEECRRLLAQSVF